jgi:hypothetical protein
MTNENDSGWDSLADELGIEPAKSNPHAEPPAKPKPEPARPAPRRPERDPRPEIEQEADDFGAGVVEEQIGSAETIYDPGAGPVEDDIEEPGAETYEDVHEGYEPPGESEPEGEGQEGGKRRRRRRRRRKKGGPESEEAPADVEMTEGETDVEEGEAPAPVEGDDDDEVAPPSAMEEELEEEVAQQRPEWHVMTWMELVGKLHRPG